MEAYHKGMFRFNPKVDWLNKYVNTPIVLNMVNVVKCGLLLSHQFDRPIGFK